MRVTGKYDPIGRVVRFVDAQTSTWIQPWVPREIWIHVARPQAAPVRRDSLGRSVYPPASGVVPGAYVAPVRTFRHTATDEGVRVEVEVESLGPNPLDVEVAWQ